MSRTVTTTTSTTSTIARRRRRVGGRWTQTVASTRFPAAPDPGWSPGQAARWEAAGVFADTHQGGVLAVEHRPGSRRMLTLWAATGPVAVAVVHLGTPLFGQTWAAYLAVGLACPLFPAGYAIQARIEARHHLAPPDATDDPRAAAAADGFDYAAPTAAAFEGDFR